MLVGVPKETKDNEFRVGIVPSTVRELTDKGHRVLVETGAGTGAGLPDGDYKAAGAEIVPDADRVYGSAELIVKVKEPLPTARKKLRPGQGSREALKEDPHLRYGLNVHAGRVTDRAVADALNLPYADADHSLQI